MGASGFDWHKRFTPLDIRRPIRFCWCAYCRMNHVRWGNKQARKSRGDTRTARTRSKRSWAKDVHDG